MDPASSKGDLTPVPVAPPSSETKSYQQSNPTPPSQTPEPTKSCCRFAPSTTFAHISDVAAVHLLAFVGGYVDAAGYLKFKGVFTSSITGNLVVACASVMSLKGAVCRSCVCIAFTASGCAASLVSLKLRLAHGIRPRPLAILLFFFELALFVVVWGVGWRLNDDIDGTDNLDAWQVVLGASLLGASMGFHNVAAKETIANCPPTTVMTSTLINVAGGFSNVIGLLLASCCCRLTPPTGPRGTYAAWTQEDGDALVKLRNEAIAKLLPLFKPLLWFIVGCIVGAVVMSYGQFHSMAIPLAIVVFLMVDIYLKEAADDTRKDVAKEAALLANDDTPPKYQLYFQGTTVMVKAVPPAPAPVAGAEAGSARSVHL